MVKKKKSMYWKNLRRSILHSKSRFLSIFSIVLLGAAFFAGLRNTPGTMMESMDAYLDKNHFADLTYMASLGFSEDDIQSIKDTQGIEDVAYGYQFDALMKEDDKLSGVTVYTSEAYNKDMINCPDLLEGRYPTQDDECLIDNELAKTGIKLDQTIHLSNDQGQKDFKVVGIVNDPRYIARTERGTNTLGDGTNEGYIEILNKENSFLAMPKELYDLRDEKILYNQISIRVKGALEETIFTEDYDDIVEEVNTKVKSTLSLRMSDLYDDLTRDARKTLDDAKEEYEKGLNSYNKNKDAFDTQILEAKIQLTNAKIELGKKETELLKAQNQASDQTKQMIQTLEETSKELQQNLEQLQKELQEKPESKEEITSIDPVLKNIQEINELLKNTSSSVEGIDQLTEANLALENAKLQIQQQENQLTLQELQTSKQLEEAKEKLDSAHSEIQKGEKEIDSIPKGKLYTLTRHENAGVVSFESNKDSIASIANVFPLMFFLVSALVSLTTMTRMVEEQRGQSGTLRALGYSKWDVMKQYVVYVILATLFACLIGIVAGTYFFPGIIYYLYRLMLFQVDAPIVIYSSVLIIVETVCISVLVTMFVTLLVCMNELNLMPAVLMRPKAPKIGKRILLERINFIWRRLSFNQKVTMRNIFRYKKRFFMSVIGIAGCTALIVTGFGIKNSVSQVVDKQYEDIFQYDALVRLEDPVSTHDAKEYQDQLLKRDEVNNIEYVYNQSIQLLKNKQELYGSLVVYQSMDNIQNFIQFKDFYNHKKISLDDEGVVLSAKTAELLDVSENDNVDIELNGQKYNVKVSSIMENYFMNYMYMSQTYYEDLTGKQLEVNNAYMNMKKMTPSFKASIENYMQEKGYGNLSYIDTFSQEFDQQVQSIDMVIIILVVCAGALNFIVLYNLTNINIQERKSEIATIKVLGFRRKEVYDYIFRENIILSVIGSLLGLIFGRVLHGFIIRTVELDVTMFIRQLNIESYIFGILFTMIFTYFINFVMRRVLNKVDMVESLKSIE